MEMELEKTNVWEKRRENVKVNNLCRILEGSFFS